MNKIIKVVSMLFMLGLPVAVAAESQGLKRIIGLDKIVVLNAREQSVDLFFSELFGQVNVPVQVDSSIMGTVNGDFQKPASDLINEISTAFQLGVYYDGAVAYVYPANDITRVVLHLSSDSASSIRRTARKMGMLDSRNTLSVIDAGLVVTGARRFVDQVEKLSDALGRKTKTKKSVSADSYEIFKLKYAWADDVSLKFGGESVKVPGVASLLRSLIEPGAMSAPSVTRTIDSASLNGLRGEGLNRGSQPIRSVDAGSTANSRIVADPLSNSIIIRDRPERMATYASLIASLDKEPQMVEIEATIIDLDTDKLRELGINWRLSRNDGELLVGDTEVNSPAEGGVVSLLLGSREQFISRIRALETQGAARIVSKPHVMTLSNVEALLDTTSTFFVRVAGQEEVDLFDVKVGTTLRVTPHVYTRGGLSQIKLRVNINDGATSDQSVDKIPVVEESTINTQAIVNVGQSLLIGGLVREIKGNGVSRVPLLGSLPGVGALFRTKTIVASRNERLFLITPRLSTKVVAGKRFSAPIFSGTQNDIIASSVSRMDATSRALDKREQPTRTVTDYQAPITVEPPAFGEWQAVGRTISSGTQSANLQAAKSPLSVIQPPVLSSRTVPVDEDGWQEISQ